MWKETVDACPLIGSKSRIIVTTSVRSVATACSSGSYVYSVQSLADDDSESLFWRNVYGKQRKPSFSLATASESIFRKCGGLPLALTTVAKYLYLKGNDLNSGHFEDVGRNLGKDYLLGNNNTAMSVFNGMRRVLRECYDNLPDYDLRFFLLYLSIFPRGHQIKKMNLVRRLKSEGLVLSEDCKCFDELIDRCIIEPVQIFKNSLVVKSCQVRDLVLEYIIQKSLDKNVVTLIQGPETLLIGKTGASVRRLSVQSSTKESFHELEDRSAALRSLSIFDSEAFDLQSCMMLRLLDLESCKGIDKTFLKGLCKLRLLRYLSLRNTCIDELPRQIEKLECLETLDIRGGTNNVTKLPMKQVFMLRKLAYLFGKFQLHDVPDSQEEIGKLYDFLQKRSVLHTLSGFVANKRHGLEHVILYARKLKNVKVWCNDTSADPPTCISVPNHPSNRSQGTIMRCTTRMERNRPCNRSEGSRNVANFDFIRILKKRSTTLESVSIVSSGLCQDFLGSLEGPCRIRSIKLRGNLDRLPTSDKLSELGRIKELQLFSTGRTTKELSVLQYLRGLEYLKLVEYSERFCNGIFIVEEKGFESLNRLCIDAPMLPKMQFKKGAMESLTSLHLLCPHPKKQPSETVEGIRHLANLTEVIHNSPMQKAWETVANENPNRPCVKRQAE